ncbi:exostosin domain-containing protein [Algoriphagus machipongonensis]|uniref:Exostosin GT47 domain-containing protein n=1 Tax=Algoriphagus machipongonensis TaxID=388413 RepID=A3HRD9_9BACT|nr:exostosin family protein [Algoriphagus machipongonensis]EAZ82407.1 hypothetical protein ALPR1_09340 [Algoriphagus machipongonensis]
MVKLFIGEGDFKSNPLFEIFQYEENGSIGISPLAKPFFRKVEEAQDADWLLMPVFITSLTSPKGQELIKEFVNLGKKCQKPVGVFSNSDYLTDPGSKDVWIFSPGTYRSIQNLVELPAVIPFDPVEKWFKGDWRPLDKSKSNSLGFCGQATLHPLKALKDYLKLSQVRKEIDRGISPFLYVPFFLPVWERGRLLKNLSKHKSLKTDFVLRQKYRGGYGSEEHAIKTEREFFENIEKNLFTLCLRGSGNYSVRFYQTLAMGRIPVLIDTDSNLPYEDVIPYQDLIVKVPYSERTEVGSAIQKFLEGKSDEDLQKIQSKCRQVWKDAFQPPGSLEFFAKKLNRIALNK